jgi:hypothetical protein
VNSPHPHSGAHVHFDNSKNRWPKGKDKPANYPAIYAVADGVIGRIDTRFGLSGGKDRYGVVISACISSRMPRHDPERRL